MRQPQYQAVASEGGTAIYPTQLDGRIAEVGAMLAQAFQQVLAGLPGAPHKPQELAKHLSINKDISSRLLKATQSRDPVAVAHLIPGPDPLRRLLRSAARRQVEAGRIRHAERAVNEFEILIGQLGGDRSGLDSVISAWLPEVREKLELLSKQAIFKGTAQLKGFATDVDLFTYLLHPSSDGLGIDTANLIGLLGLRRLRPGVRVTCTMQQESPTPVTSETLGGQPVTDIDGLLLRQFCSAPDLRFEVHREGVKTHYILSGDDVGPEAAVDVVMAQRRRSSQTRQKKCAYFCVNQTPARKGIFDVLVHEELYQQFDPQLAVYDTTVNGLCHFGDPNRALALLDVKVNIEPLGRGLARFRTLDVPNYPEMLREVCRQLQWDEQAFRGYRCAVEYPVYGSQVIVAFNRMCQTRNDGGARASDLAPLGGDGGKT
jgi:hypothetical protein